MWSCYYCSDQCKSLSMNKAEQVLMQGTNYREFIKKQPKWFWIFYCSLSSQDVCFSSNQWSNSLENSNSKHIWSECWWAERRRFRRRERLISIQYSSVDFHMFPQWASVKASSERWEVHMVLNWLSDGGADRPAARLAALWADGTSAHWAGLRSAHRINSQPLLQTVKVRVDVWTEHVQEIKESENCLKVWAETGSPSNLQTFTVEMQKQWLINSFVPRCISCTYILISREKVSH